MEYSVTGHLCRPLDELKNVPKQNQMRSLGRSRLQENKSFQIYKSFQQFYSLTSWKGHVMKKNNDPACYVYIITMCMNCFPSHCYWSSEGSWEMDKMISILQKWKVEFHQAPRNTQAISPIRPTFQVPGWGAHTMKCGHECCARSLSVLQGKPTLGCLP